MQSKQTSRLILAAIAAVGVGVSIYFDRAAFAALFGFTVGVWLCAWVRAWAVSMGVKLDQEDG